MKQIVVIVAGTGQAHDLTIAPGTSAGDVLRKANLSGYHLSKGGGELPFAEGENVYPAVADGDKLFAAAKTDVGAAAQALRN